MRQALALLAVLGMTAGFFSANAADEKDEKFEATCPVSGKPAVKEQSAKFKGKTVYFCCPNCPKAYKADQKKFINAVYTQLLETKQITQVACPLSGKPVDTSKTAVLGKTTVAFCCGNCQGKAKESDDLAKLAFADFDKGFTLQTTCPVSGKPIAVDNKVSHEGKNVYFCCPNCPKAFEADPAKYVARLPQFPKPKKAKN
ncbi:YHS domain-containing protein [bacterium]|nr:YHS domain-containing protein [bacterium]